MTPRRTVRYATLTAITAGCVVALLAALGMLDVIDLSGPALVVYATVAGLAALSGVVAVAIATHEHVETAFQAGVQLASRRGPSHIVPEVRRPRSHRVWRRLLIVGFVAPFLALAPVVVYETTRNSDATADAARELADAQQPQSPVQCMRVLDDRLRNVTCEPLKSDEPTRADEPRCWLWIAARTRDTLARIPCDVTLDSLGDKYPRLLQRARSAGRLEGFAQ